MTTVAFIVGSAEGGTRTPMSYLTRPSNVRVYQFRHFGLFNYQQTEKRCACDQWQRSNQGLPFVFAAGELCVGAAFVLPVSLVAGAALGCCCVSGEAIGCCCDGDATGIGSGSASTTERDPVIPGDESTSAPSMKSAAAPMVIFANSVCVPRGPKAVLEIELVKSAPASALPGCKSTTPISTMQLRRNNP